MGLFWMYEIFLLLAFSVTLSSVKINKFVIDLDLDNVLHTVDKEFLSVVMGFGTIKKHGLCLNLSDTKLITLTKGLKPAYLRLGGTKEDFATFVPDGIPIFPQSKFSKCEQYDKKNGSDQDSLHKPIPKQFNITGFEVDHILKFARSTGLEMFYGLNVLKRNGNHWDPTNAKLLLDYIAKKGFRINWQLGNEPPFGKFKIDLEPDQLAKDFYQLRQLLNTYSLFKDSLLVGPDIGQFKNKKGKAKYYKTFIKNAFSTINAVTWHMYYTNGKTAKIDDFLNPDLLDILRDEIRAVSEITRKYSSNVPLWLGETGSAYGGGARGLSDRYVAGFMWLDKLGLSAKHKINVVMRESIFDARYELLNVTGFDPFPDYWLSLVFKRLVGERVLDVKLKYDTNSVRVYAHCVKRSQQAPFQPGAVVIYALNLLKNSIQVEWPLISGKNIHSYVLTPGDGDLLSKNVLLNGKMLIMPNEHTLPNIEPVIVKNISLPKLSFGFFVVDDAKAKVCSI